MRIKKDAVCKGSSDIYRDIIAKGHFYPLNYLEDIEDSKRVFYALAIIDEYIQALQDSGKLEEM